MVYADLHAHTVCSDGQLTYEELPDIARTAGVSVVAVTDHDRVHPDFEAAVERHEGGPDEAPVTLVRGVELRVESPAGRVDLLGYGVEPTDDVVAVERRIQENRRERGRAIVECVEDRLGIDLDVEIRAGLGRPHIARAIDEHPASGHDYGEAFETLIGGDGPCYVAREVPDFDEGVRVLEEACALVGLAHPLRYRDPEAALALTRELDAVELPYPYDGPVDRRPVECAIAERDLVVTGGSDAHERRLGLAGLSREEYDPVRERLPDPTTV